MIDTFIHDFIHINAELNLDYRESKLPEFIKKIILKRRRKKMYGIVNKISDAYKKELQLPFYRSYIDTILNTYPPEGKYKHCVAIDVDEDRNTTSTFRVKINDNYSVMGSVIDKNEDVVSIAYTIFLNGVAMTNFTIENQEVLINGGSHTTNQLPWNHDVENKCANDIIVEAIVDDINNFLLDTIERFERINT